MKKCFKCGKLLSLDSFYNCPTMKDGHFNKCKECYAIDSNAAYEKNRLNPDWVKKERLRHSEKYRRLKYKDKLQDREKCRLAVELNNEKYPEKYSARSMSKSIIAPPGMVKHHWSYLSDHYKDLIFLSHDHHVIAHRYMIYDPERCQYRNTVGELLDTKQSHLEYINNCIINHYI